jgi:tetratricopeptide (TPR) repeat protein
VPQADGPHGSRKKSASRQATACFHCVVARSLHATHRTPLDLRDEEDLDRKRLIKRLVSEERRRPRERAQVVASEAIPISVRDLGPFVHYPASANDVRAVLSRLPLGIAVGIGSIELCLAEGPEEPERSVDPFLGRLDNEFVPGIFGGAVLGRYRPNGSTIQLFGYLYDPSRADREIVDLYLRLKMLATFVHEVAHHDDFSARTGRRQWRAEDSYGREVYAEAMQYAWTQDCVVPYLEEAYPLQVAELRRWVDAYGGISLPLGDLAGDPRTTGGIDGERLFFSVDVAFESLLSMVARGERPPATQVQFATELHWGTNDEDALAVVARVLAEYPGNASALALLADISLDQGRVDEAQEIAQALLVRNEENTEALRVIRDVARLRGDWPGMLAAVARLLASQGQPSWWVSSNLELQVRGLIELGEFARAEATFAQLVETDKVITPMNKRRNERLRCLGLLRRGECAEALATSVDLLAEAPQDALLLAIRFDAAHQLLRPAEAGDLADWACERLRRQGYGAWVETLSALRRPSS